MGVRIKLRTLHSQPLIRRASSNGAVPSRRLTDHGERLASSLKSGMPKAEFF